MEVSLARSRALARGINPSMITDEVTAKFFHQLADQKGIPDDLNGHRYRCKLTGYILEGKTMQEAQNLVFLQAQGVINQTSCFPHTIAVLLGSPIVNGYVHPDEYYEKMTDMEIRQELSYRCGNQFGGFSAIDSVRQCDYRGFPDWRSMRDASNDNFDMPTIQQLFADSIDYDIEVAFRRLTETKNNYSIKTYVRSGNDIILREY